LIKFLILFSLFIKEKSSYIDSTLNFLWNGNYEEVRKRIEVLKEKLHENDPLPFLLRVIYLYQFMQDYAKNDSENVFLKEIEKVIEISEKNKEDILWGKFCKASGFAYKAMWLFDKENYAGALKDGMEAVNLYTECMENNFFLKDYYLALGIYNYGTSILQKYTKEIIFKGERKEKGIEQIEISYKEGKFTKPLSAIVLIQIYSKERGKREKAIQIAENLYKEFPNSRISLWQLGLTYASCGKWEKAKEIFEKLFKNIEENQKDSYYMRAAIRYYLAKTNNLLKNKEIAKKYIKEAEKLIKKSRWHKRKYLEKRIYYVKKILEK